MCSKIFCRRSPFRARYRERVITPRSGSWRTSLVPRKMPARDRDHAVRLPDEVWLALLRDPATVAAYHSRVYRRQPDQDWFWLGAISEDGQAKLRVPRHMGERVIAAPVFGWQISRGPLRPEADGTLPVIRHSCDESACLNPLHWLTGTRRDNMADWTSRKDDPFSPLKDKRGPAGRARAIRDAIVAARKDGSDIEKAITRAMIIGMPDIQDQLFG